MTHVACKRGPGATSRWILGHLDQFSCSPSECLSLFLCELASFACSEDTFSILFLLPVGITYPPCQFPFQISIYLFIICKFCSSSLFALLKAFSTLAVSPLLQLVSRDSPLLELFSRSYRMMEHFLNQFLAKIDHLYSVVIFLASVALRQAEWNMFERRSS